LSRGNGLLAARLGALRRVVAQLEPLEVRPRPQTLFADLELVTPFSTVSPHGFPVEV